MRRSRGIDVPVQHASVSKIDEKPGAPNPFSVCLVITVMCCFAYTIPYYSQPHHPWEVDILSGVESNYHQSSPDGNLPEFHRQHHESKNNNDIYSDTKGNDERPSWLLEEIELIYKQALHKSAITSMQMNDGTRNVWDLFEGSWQCMSQERIGKIGDGGKWICNPHELRKKKKPKCLIYSFGSAGESSFEEEAYEKYNCEIHSFDPTLDSETQLKLSRKSSQFHFHPWGLRGRKDGILPDRMSGNRHHRNQQFDSNYKSLKQIMKELHHTHIDVLKVDIEGSEWNVFNDDLLCPSSSSQDKSFSSHLQDDTIDDKISNVFDHLPNSEMGNSGGDRHTMRKTEEEEASLYSLPFDQLSVELHWSGTDSPEIGEKDLFEFMRGMHVFGYKMFHREGNALDIQHCWEYSFVKTSSSIDSRQLNSFLDDCQQSFDIRHKQALEWVHSQ